MDSNEIMHAEATFASGGVERRPLILERGEGAYVWDASGRRYLDLMAGHGWAALGHSHPAVTAAITAQAKKLIMCSEAVHNEQRARWMQTLAGILPWQAPRIHPCNSGAEAVEAAIKLARALTGRAGIVAAKRAFHGRTCGALSATWNKTYRQPFEPLLADVKHITFNDLASAEAAIDQHTAAVFVEPVQGEGGVYPAEREFLEGLRKLCSRHGALLVLDEIQTGLGRTGSWWAAEHFGVVPDILCSGKALGGGIPMGAIAWNGDLGRFAAQTHGSTFGGNPLACAASLAVLETIASEELCAHAAALGAKALKRLQSMPSRLIREVRGVGLMIGVDLRTRVTPILKELIEHGVLALPAGPTVLRLLPPLIISESELDSALDTIEEVLQFVEVNQ